MPGKCILILLDGLGDRSFPELDHKTPLQAAQTPHLDRLARDGANGLFHAARLGQALPSENAHFAIFGYDMDQFPGRGALEALGAGIPLGDHQVALLAHFATVRETEEGALWHVDGKPRATAQEAGMLFDAVAAYAHRDIEMRLHPTQGLRAILTMSGDVAPFVTDTDPILNDRPVMAPQPWASHARKVAARDTAEALATYLEWVHRTLGKHPVNAARKAAGQPLLNGIVTQRAGRLGRVTPFTERFGIRGLSIAGGIVYHGLARYLGLDGVKAADTDDPAADMTQRLDLAREALAHHDFIHVHTKMPDEAAHTKDPVYKKQVIEALDRGIGAALPALLQTPELLLVIAADHSTPSGGPLVHSGEPVPIIFHGPGLRRDHVRVYDEISAPAGALGMVRGKELIYLVLNHLDRIKLQGLMDTPRDQPYWPGVTVPFRLAGTERPAAAAPDQPHNRPSLIYPTGVIHGRFQILHNDHLKYLLAGKALCRHLVVGITNPDPLLTKPEDNDGGRSDPSANPLSYYERALMVRAVLREAGLAPHDFSVVPFPINLPELYAHYVPMDGVFLLSIYDDWGKRKLGYFQSLGLKTHVLWRVSPDEKGISAADIRRRLISGRPWQHLVPGSVPPLIEDWKVAERLQRLHRDPSGKVDGS